MSAASSQELQWLLTRKTSSYIVKQKGLPRFFTREPLNLKQIHSPKHSGNVCKKAVGIAPAANGKGVVVTTKKTKASPFSVKGSRASTTIKGTGNRRVSGAVANIVGKRGYRNDLAKLAVARASAILLAQRGSRKAPLPKKVRGTGANKVLIEKSDE
ncbi:uncharacterized protein PFL1_01607 [Pseudozyma flocculosa PF-1]|uniref:Related to 60S ribosomal protein L28 n=1 Tax=Pseudozyma flocculosa TaxID=84751 RepID=A0A5C3EYK4_9BASI|nr:uncharacterized protein PFL1_01607 [Pseudozyma flocculosa PF-1]EPQ30706.1 hypothetical protein PFL1_01607 [Pseudozyma flocculosa PF-1]SPO36950.1 related to 60S ribosomal protein L28 [Pseudozyma flocculosa]